jgi:hypothetical protein
MPGKYIKLDGYEGRERVRERGREGEKMRNSVIYLCFL